MKRESFFVGEGSCHHSIGPRPLPEICFASHRKFRPSLKGRVRLWINSKARALIRYPAAGYLIRARAFELIHKRTLPLREGRNLRCEAKQISGRGRGPIEWWHDPSPKNLPLRFRFFDPPGSA